jgi:hypothetical protein
MTTMIRDLLPISGNITVRWNGASDFATDLPIAFDPKRHELLSIDSDPKTQRSNRSDTETLTAIMYLAPFTLSGHNVCPRASEGCILACLNTAGKGGMASTQVSRLRKTAFFWNDKSGFIAQLTKEIAAFVKRCNRLGLRPVVRLNGTSDIAWEHIGGIMALFPMIQYYDYTKVPSRIVRNRQPNYYLVFSRSETNEADCIRELEAGRNVVVVWRHKRDIPKMWGGSWVIPGDADDLRFLDPRAPTGERGYVVALYAKGKARKDTSGFVLDAE